MVHVLEEKSMEGIKGSRSDGVEGGMVDGIVGVMEGTNGIVEERGSGGLVGEVIFEKAFKLKYELSVSSKVIWALV